MEYLNSVVDFFKDMLAWGKSFLTDGSWFNKDQDVTQWVLSTLYIMLKEYLTVIIQLVCFSRVALGDFFTGPLILFMMLVSFGFPFLSSYLFFVLRLGPWYNRGQNWMGCLRLVFQVVLVVGAQIFGAWTAAKFINDKSSIWRDSGMTLSGINASWSFNSVDKTVIVSDSSLPGLEEGFNSFIFLIGLLHLMETDAVGLMSNAFFNQKEERKKVDLESAVVVENGVAPEEVSESLNDLNGKGGTTSSVDLSGGQDIETQQPRRYGHLRPLPPGAVKKGGVLKCFLGVDAAASNDNRRRGADTELYTEHVGIPIAFIVHVCLLLAATSRAFPTAHGTPAVSLFLRWLNVIDDKIMISRISGGSVGTIFALFYYYIWYVWPAKYQSKIPETFIKSVIVAPPAFLTGQLQLPHGMNKKR